MAIPHLLTIPQAANILGVHRDTIYNLIARGELAVTEISTGATKGGGGRSKSRIREDVLTDFIERRTRMANQSSPTRQPHA